MKKSNKIGACLVAALALLGNVGGLLAAPVLQIDWQTGEAKLLGTTGELSGFKLSAKSIDGGASDVVINPGDSNALGSAGSDGIPDGESYFARRTGTFINRYVGFNVLQDTTVNGAPSGANIGAAPGGLTQSNGVIDPGGFVAGDVEISFTADLPHVLGLMFKPMNPALTQASATQNLRFLYLVPNVQGQNAGEIRLVNGGTPPNPPEPASLTLLGVGLLGLVAARRRQNG